MKKVVKEESKTVPKKASNKKATPESEPAITAKKPVVSSPEPKNKRNEKVESKKKAQEDVQAVAGEDTTSEE